MAPIAGRTHHFVLSDGQTSLGLLSADDMRTFVRIPVSRTSIKTASGDTLYSDLEPPYHTKAQKDFSGGRGQRYLREDETRYYDSTGVDARFSGQLTLGPRLDTFTAANVGIPEHLPGNSTPLAVSYIYDGNIPPGLENCISIFFSIATYSLLYQSFTALSEYIEGASAYIKLATYNITSTRVRAELYSDSGGYPGTLVAQSDYVEIHNTDFSWVNFTFTGGPISVTKGATYWLHIANHPDDTEKGFGWLAQYPGTFSRGRVRVKSEAYTWEFADDPYQPYIKYQDFVFKINHPQWKRAQAFNYSGSGSYSVSHLYLFLRRDGYVGADNVKVELQTDSGGVPSGTLVPGTSTMSLSDDDIPTTFSWVRVQLPSPVNLTKGVTYHIVLYMGESKGGWRYVRWGADASGGYSGGGASYKVGTNPWAQQSGYDHYFKINSGQGLDDETLMFFQYQGALYAVAGPTSGTGASSIWMNGYKGRAADNSADKTKLISANVNGASPGWTTDEWAGAIVYIWSGPGRGEYRTIVSNTANQLTVSDSWDTVHTNDTLYVILGSNKWTNVTPTSGVTLEHRVTDVLVCNAIVYFCQGDKGYVVRYREYWDATSSSWRRSDGTSNTCDHDGTNYADYMVQIKDKVWRSTSVNQISNASVVSWPNNLSYGTAINIGTDQYYITGLSIYDGDLVVGKEDSLYIVKNGQAEKVPIDFLQMADRRNCAAMTAWDLFLFFSLGYGLERLYGQHVDDMGPNRDVGLPTERVGPITCLMGTPGTLLAGVDAGSDGYSSVLAWNGSGWHELVRCPTLGDSVRDMWIQVLPGRINRLWIAMGNDCAWIPLPEQGVNPLKESGYMFAPSGELVTSWLDMALVDVPKYFHQLKLVTENLSEDHREITAYYRVDDDEDWTLIGAFTKSPIESLSIGETSVTGRRIQFKFVLTTDDSSQSPNLIAYTVESLGRLPPKSRFEPTILIDDNLLLMDGQRDTNTRADILRQLDEWAGSATPLTLTTCDPAFSRLTVWIEPPIEIDKVLEKHADRLRLVGGRARLIIMEA